MAQDLLDDAAGRDATRGGRLSPSTIWVPRSVRAKETSAVATSSSTTSWNVPSNSTHELARQRSCQRSCLDRARVDDVHGEELGAGARGDARRAAQQGLVGVGAGDRDDEALAGLPGLGDVVVV